MLFGRRKPQITVQEALASKPVQSVSAEVARNDDGTAKLKVPLRGGLLGGLIRIPEGASKTFELDPIGLLVWDSCDGKTSVQQIIRKVAKRYNLSSRESQVATIKFMQLLVKKGLLAMATPKQQQQKEPATK